MNLSGAIDRGLDFIQAAQSRAGFWSDWRLPPGESRMWTTAYLGYRLSMLSGSRAPALETSLGRAAQWLRDSELQGGGWGYSLETGADADSTSLAVLFLRSRGSNVSDASLRCLRQHQHGDGGFSTYTTEASFGSWTESHPEVTATALLALQTPGTSTEVDSGVSYLRARRRADGLWNSFWWTSCLYGTEAAVTLFGGIGEAGDQPSLTESLGRIPISCAFEEALLLSCLTQLGPAGLARAVARARLLVARQLPDGSWPSAPVLRLTSRHVTEPWRVKEPGPLFEDHRRVFTTATVVAALDRLEAASDQPR